MGVELNVFSTVSSIPSAVDAPTHTWLLTSVFRGIAKEAAKEMVGKSHEKKEKQMIIQTNVPRHEKICLRGFRPGKTQTGLLSFKS